MRALVAILLVSGGCFDFSGPSTWTDPCASHGNSGSILANDCSCPLISQIGPQLDGTTCSQSGQRCATAWIGEGCTCEGEPLHWYCDGDDLATPSPPPDLLFELDGGGSAAVD